MRNCFQFQMMIEHYNSTPLVEIVYHQLIQIIVYLLTLDVSLPLHDNKIVEIMYRFDSSNNTEWWFSFIKDTITY